MHPGYDFYALPPTWDARERLARLHVHYFDCRDTFYLVANSLHSPDVPGRIEGLGDLFRTPDEAKVHDGFLVHTYGNGGASPLRVYGRWLEATAGEPWESMQRLFDVFEASAAVEHVRAMWGKWRPVHGRAEPVWLWFVLPTASINGHSDRLLRFIDATSEREFQKSPVAVWTSLEMIATFASGESA